jgi:hypothetical protein
VQHPFILSIGSAEGKPVCMKCHRSEKDHTDQATCDACPNVGPCDMFPNIEGMLLCQECIAKELAIHNSPEKQQERVNALLHNASKIDTSIQVRTDIFNAQTVSIHELKSLIDADASIENKNFELAKRLTERLNGFKQAIFELNEAMLTKVSEQRSVQTYLNDLSNKLRSIEREEIKLKDISYQPPTTKITKPKPRQAMRLDKAEISKASKETNIPEHMVQMVCVQKGWTPIQFIESFTKSKEVR